MQDHHQPVHAELSEPAAGPSDGRHETVVLIFLSDDEMVIDVMQARRQYWDDLS